MYAALAIETTSPDHQGSWEQIAAQAPAAGITAAQIVSDTKPEQIVTLERLGVCPAVIQAQIEGRSCCLVAPQAETRDLFSGQCCALIEQAAGWSASVLTIQPLTRPDSAAAAIPYADALHLTIEALRKLVEPCARWDLALGVEAAADGFLTSPAELRDLLEQVNCPTVGACLDVPRIAAISSPADWIRTLRHRLACLRLDPLPDEPLNELLAALEEIRFDGPVVCRGPLDWASRLAQRLPRWP